MGPAEHTAISQPSTVNNIRKSICADEKNAFYSCRLFPGDHSGIAPYFYQSASTWPRGAKGGEASTCGMYRLSNFNKQEEIASHQLAGVSDHTGGAEQQGGFF